MCLSMCVADAIYSWPKSRDVSLTAADHCAASEQEDVALSQVLLVLALCQYQSNTAAAVMNLVILFLSSTKFKDVVRS